MSIATLVLTIIFFINLGFFLIGNPEVNSPMFALLKVIVTGDYNINWGAVFPPTYIATVTAVALGVALVAGFLTGGIGIFGGFNAVHTLTVIAIALFLCFAAIPNFSAMGFPPQLLFVIQMIFAFMILLAVYGLFKNE